MRQPPTNRARAGNHRTRREGRAEEGDDALVHGLLELLLVEELEDEEDELAAERRHGVGGGGGGRSPPGARSARPGARLAEGAALVAGPPGRPRILGFRRRPPSSPLASEAETIEKRRCGRGVGERERNFSLAFFDALQTSRPFLSPHATHHWLICEKHAPLLIINTAYRYARALMRYAASGGIEGAGIKSGGYS